MTPVVRTLLSSLLLTGLTMPSLAWQAGFEDVVRNLRNPDPEGAPERRSHAARIAAHGRGPFRSPRSSTIRSTRIQLEGDRRRAVVLPRPGRACPKRVGLVVEVRSKGQAVQAFEQGPLAAWPRPVPLEVVDAPPQGGRRRESARPNRGHLCARRRGAAAADRRRLRAADQGARSLRSGDPCRSGESCRAISDVKRAGDTLINVDQRFELPRSASRP